MQRKSTSESASSQHGSRVDIKDLAHAGKQLHEKVIDINPRQRGICQGLQVLETQRNSDVT
jgi:hypothetical protein